ncbi:peptidoglycan-binding protein [Leptolyngbya sp. FACHB-261]|uniref:peptidoglycan-binding domain-containing protein n=1 Tax=Leptolyngbya sp. FACHB-261 TaxID=2692806 RepID=UPI001684CE18|nr:peptidoglycan-binding protein [Leptolyngbya sp. FACHB-261]MBD2099296.1 peptidoglycan-binding protein [Leptolyngbya sp. FACHB-261]
MRSLNPPATVSPGRTYTNKPLLYRGSRSAEVMEVQKLLAHWQIYSGPFDGVFNATVENTIKAFQHRVFLPEDGVVGSQTWQALYTGSPVDLPTLSLGSQGDEVRLLQSVLRLTRDYLEPNWVDGDFGAATQQAVVTFQRRYGLVADGTVGPSTWYMLSKFPH